MELNKTSDSIFCKVNKVYAGSSKEVADDTSWALGEGAAAASTDPTSSQSAEAGLISPVPLPVAERRPVSGRRSANGPDDCLRHRIETQLCLSL